MTGRGHDHARAVAAAQRLHPGADGSPGLDRLAALAARILRCPSGQITLVGHAASAVGYAGSSPTGVPDLSLDDSLCTRTVVSAAPHRIGDTRAEPDLAALPAVASGVAVSYLGVPIASDTGVLVGAMCVYGPEPREWTDDDVATLTELAAAAAAELELGALTRDYDLSRARWNVAIEVAGVGSFDWHIPSNRLSWDAALVEMFGYSDDDRFGETIEDFVARLHPDDVPVVNAAMQRAIDTLGVYECQYRIVLPPDGRVRDIQARGRALGAGGTADRLVGAAWDVTATRRGEERAARIVEAMPVAYLAVGADEGVLAMNHVAETLLGVDRRAVVGSATLAEVLPVAHVGELLVASRTTRDTGRSQTVEIDLQPRAGAAGLAGTSSAADTWLELRVWPEGDGVALYFTDITDRHRAQAAAEQAVARDRAVAAALQDALLTTLPERDHLELAARYAPATEGGRVGGDWYDAVVQPNGATTLVVGDVVGHDVAAAATMGQLRSMTRAFVWEGDASPATVTARLDQVVRDLYPGALATMVVARIEQSPEQLERDERTLRWTAAGHPPPALVTADGEVTLLTRRPEILVGVDASRTRSDHTVTLPAGATLLLYTDGLVERREEVIDVGLERLVATLREHHRLPLDELLDLLVSAVPRAENDDDVAVLAVRVHPDRPGPAATAG